MAGNADEVEHDRLLRVLLFLAAECGAAGADEGRACVDHAIRLHRGSPSEFRGEADHALKVVAASTCLPRSVRYLAGAVRDELPFPAAH
jgi:hypothetical protein